MGTKTTIVIFNEETNKHEPMAEGDVISEEVLPPPRKVWLGKISFAVEHVASGTDYGAIPALEIGSTYFAYKVDKTDDFSNVGQGADESLPFVATGTTPTQWKYTGVYKLVEELTTIEHYNTIGFTVAPSLHIGATGVVGVLTTSVPYWNAPLAIYNDTALVALSATEARTPEVYGTFTSKVMLELL